MRCQRGAGLQSWLMTCSIGLCLLAALACATACGPKGVPPPNVTSWELRGSVAAISACRLDVRHKSGRVIELAIDDRQVGVVLVEDEQSCGWRLCGRRGSDQCARDYDKGCCEKSERHGHPRIVGPTRPPIIQRGLS